MKQKNFFFITSLVFSVLVFIACTQPFVFNFDSLKLSDFLSLSYKAHSFDFFQNILLFIPMSFFWYSYFEGYKKTIVICVVFSLFFECMQLFIPARTSSVFDVIANSIGVFLGILCSRKFSSLFSFSSSTSFQKILKLYVCFFIIYSFYPFDLSFHPVEIYRSFKAGKLVLIPFSDAGNPFKTVIISLISYIPLGVFFASYKPVRSFVLISILVAFSFEALQIFVLNRFSSTTDCIFGALGFFIGTVLFGLYDSKKNNF